MVALLNKGKRPEIDLDTVPDLLANVMTMCWEFEQKNRPTASQVVDMILGNVSARDVGSKSPEVEVNKKKMKLSKSHPPLPPAHKKKKKKKKETQRMFTNGL